MVDKRHHKPSLQSLADPDAMRFELPGASLWRPVAIFASCRLIVLLTIVVASFDPDAPVGGILPKLRFWDGDFYVSITADWYPRSVPVGPDGAAAQSSLAFFPLYPVLARAVGAVTPLDPLGSLLLVSFVAGLLATVLLWCLVRTLCDERAADRATLLYAAFPGSFVWSMVYTEPVLALFAIAATMALLGRRWGLAGLLAALGSASRPNGLALVLPCAFAAAAALWYRREWRALIAPLLAPLGFLATILYLGVRTGEPGVWFRVQHDAWGEAVDLGYGTLRRVKHAFVWLLDGRQADLNAVFPTIGLVLLVLLLLALWRWRPPIVLWMWTFGIVGLAFVSTQLGLRPRFLHSAFPLIAAGGVEVRGRAFVLLAALALAAQVALAYLSVTSIRAIP